MIGTGDHIAGTRARQPGNGIDTGHFHRLVDLRGAGIECTTEQEWKAQHVIHLIGVIGASGSHDHIGAHALRFGRVDFRCRVGESENNGPFAHRINHLRLHQISSRQAEKHISTLHRFAQGAQFGIYRKGRLVLVHGFGAAGIDDTTRVANQHFILVEPHVDQQVETGKGRRPGTRGDQPDLRDILVDHFKSRFHRSRHHYRGAMLIVVEHRNFHALMQVFLYVETIRCLDVFEVNAAKCRLQAFDGFRQLVRIFFIDLDIEHIDPGKALEQNGLAFHHRLGSQRADITEPEHRSTIGDHAYQVGTRRVFARREGIFFDFETGIGNTGGVSERQIVMRGHRFGGLDAQLSGSRLTVIIECFFAVFVRHDFPPGIIGAVYG